MPMKPRWIHGPGSASWLPILMAGLRAALAGEPTPPPAIRQVIKGGAPPDERNLGGAIRTESVLASEARAIQAVKLSDAIEYTPGVRLDTTCQNCGATEVRLLGLPQRYLAILQDGLPMQSGLSAVYGIEQIPVGLLERIDIVKGPGSVMVGPGSVAGSINLVPRIARETGGFLEASANQMDRPGGIGTPNHDLSGAVHLVGPQRATGLTLHGLESRVRAIDVNGDGYSEVARRRLVAPGARAWWKPGPGSQVMVDYLWTHEERRGGEMAGGALDRPPETTGIAEAIQSRRHGATVTWDHEWNADWSTRVSGGVITVGRDSYYGGTGPLGGPADPDWDPMLPPASLAPVGPDGLPVPPFNVDWAPGLGLGRSTDRQGLGDARVTWHGMENHAWTGGVQFRHETLRDRASYREVSDRYQNTGLMLEDRWNPSDRWEWVPGIRADFHRLLPRPVVSPRVAGLWRPGPEWAWRASAGSGFRAPELFDEDLHVSNVGGDLQVVRRDPSLREERSYSMLLGPEWRPGARWVADANAFFTRIEGTFFNEIDPVQDEPGLLRRTKVNADNAWVAGAEASVAFIPSSALRIEASWVEQRSEFDRPQLHLGDPGGTDPSDPAVLSRRFIRTPDRHGSLKATVRNGRWEGFMGLRATGPMRVPHVLNDLVGDASPLLGSYPGQPLRLGNVMRESPWFVVADASVTRTWEWNPGMQARLTLGCRNLSNTFQSDLDTGRYRDAAYTYGPRFPRTFFVTVGLSF